MCYGNILSDLRLDILHAIIAGCEENHEELFATFKLIKLHFVIKFFHIHEFYGIQADKIEPNSTEYHYYMRGLCLSIKWICVCSEKYVMQCLLNSYGHNSEVFWALRESFLSWLKRLRNKPSCTQHFLFSFKNIFKNSKLSLEKWV